MSHNYALSPLALPPREDGSCDLHVNHGSAQPALLQAHHVFPEYLQRQAYGKTIVQERAEVCGTGHDTVHVILRAILKGVVAPSPSPPLSYRLHRSEWLMAMRAHDAYVAAMA